MTYFRFCIVYPESQLHFVEPLPDVTVEKTTEENNSCPACQRIKMKMAYNAGETAVSRNVKAAIVVCVCEGHSI